MIKMRVRIIESDIDKNMVTEETLLVDEIKIKEEALQSAKILIKTVNEEIREIDMKDLLYMSDFLIIKKPV